MRVCSVWEEQVALQDTSKDSMRSALAGEQGEGEALEHVCLLDPLGSRMALEWIRASPYNRDSYSPLSCEAYY